MSILIKGMQMPQSCSDCQLNYDQCACSVTGTRWYSDTMVLLGFNCDEERLQNCPLVKLPEHHGKLIDEDEIIVPSLSSWSDQAMVADAIQDAPTVIEAE